MARIYLASSWRNADQPEWVKLLRNEGHDVYDFRNPEHGLGGFSWSQIHPDWQGWTPKQYIKELQEHPIAAQGFMTDLRAMMWADTCVMLNPCGKSAHLELGWMAGAGKHTIAVIEDSEPELMYLLADHIVTTPSEVIKILKT